MRRRAAYELSNQAGQSARMIKTDRCRRVGVWWRADMLAPGVARSGSLIGDRTAFQVGIGKCRSTSEPSEEDQMRIGRSLLVTTVGAILTFAVTRSPSWLNVHTVGEILIASGAVALVLGQTRRLRRRAEVIQGPTATT